jgi:beta-mannosidase
VRLTLPPHSREILMETELPGEDYALGAFCVMPESDIVEPAVLRLKDRRELRLAGGRVKVLREERQGDSLLVTVTSDRFLHAAHIVEPLRCSDNYFDLLPGQVKTVAIEGAAASPDWHSVG